MHEGKEQKKKLKKFYKDKNWEEYAILIHAIKGFMATIGADDLAVLAKKLELSAKKLDVDTILNYHNVFLSEFDEVYEEIVTMCDEKIDNHSKENYENLEVLSEEEFDTRLKNMEELMFSFDEKGLLQAVKELEKYQYHKKALKEQLENVYRKVELGDYMSALHLLSKIKVRE